MSGIKDDDAESPRGFAPEALTEPDISLSTYPARATE
jgi:hypothetical protein